MQSKIKLLPKVIHIEKSTMEPEFPTRQSDSWTF